MTDLLIKMLPFFLLIGLGFYSGKKGMLSEQGVIGLNVFVITFAMPALVIYAIAPYPLSQVFNAAFFWSYLCAELIVYALCFLLTRWLFKISIAEAAVLGLAASWGNVGYMGIAMTNDLFQGFIAPAVMATGSDMIITTGITILLVEYDKNRAALSPLLLLWALIKRVGTHPFIITLLISLLLSLTGIGIPKLIKPSIAFVSQAAGPTALFAIGASLALRPLRGDKSQIISPIALKLFALPLLFLFFGRFIFELEPQWLTIGLVLCALPTAGNVWVIAQNYRRAVERSAAVILISTLVSLASLLLLLKLLQVAA